MHYQNRHRRQGFWHSWQRLFNKQFPKQIWHRLIAWLAFGLFLFTLTACEPIPEPNQSSVGSTNRLKTVLSRGKLVCGVSGELPGFSFVNKEGKYSGLDRCLSGDRGCTI